MIAAFKRIRNINKTHRHFQETFIFNILLFSTSVNNRIYKVHIIRSSPSQMFCKIGVLKDFAKFAIKLPCDSLVFFL